MKFLLSLALIIVSIFFTPQTSIAADVPDIKLFSYPDQTNKIYLNYVTCVVSTVNELSRNDLKKGINNETASIVKKRYWKAISTKCSDLLKPNLEVGPKAIIEGINVSIQAYIKVMLKISEINAANPERPIMENQIYLMPGGQYMIFKEYQKWVPCDIFYNEIKRICVPKNK